MKTYAIEVSDETEAAMRAALDRHDGMNVTTFANKAIQMMALLEDQQSQGAKVFISEPDDPSTMSRLTW